MNQPAMKSLRETRRAIVSYLVVTLILTAIAFAFVTIRGTFLHQGYPFNCLLFSPPDRFQDFAIPAQRISHFNEPDMLTRTDLPLFFVYSLPTVYAFLFFVRCFSNPLQAYLTATLTVIVTAAACFAWSFRDSPLFRWTTALIAISVAASYPIRYLLDRANIEGIVWAFMLAGTVALVRNRPILAASAFALATSMKYFPGVLLLLFLARRQYKAAIVFLCIEVGVTALSFQIIGPTISGAIEKSKPGIALLQNDYVSRYRSTEIGFDHSAFSFLKQCLRFKYRTHELTTAHLPAYQYPYAVAAILVLSASFWFRLRHLPVTNQFIALVAFSVLLPFVSSDYTLVHVHLAFAVFLLFLVRDFGMGRVPVPRWLISSIFFAFAIIFTPESYLLIGQSTGFGGQVKALALMALISLVMIQPFSSARFGELESPGVGASGIEKSARRSILRQQR